MTGLVMQAVEGDANKCLFTRIFQLDPKGSVPTFVVNAVAVSKTILYMIYITSLVYK